MAQVSFKVTGLDNALRLDQYLIKNIRFAISRSRIQRLIEAGHILVNQKQTKAHYKVKENDSILVDVPQPEAPKVLPEKISLKIVYEDEDILVVDKPTGIVTHPAAGLYSQTLVNALLNYGSPLSTINGPLRPGIVHRLDKGTSGLMVIAKNDFAHIKLAHQFQRHTIKRRYIAIVEGRVPNNEGEIDLPIARHAQNRQKMTVSFIKKSKSALTRYKVLKRLKTVTLLELTPHTGRTHQLRVHLKFLGHPILGDQRYGRGTSFSRLALHAKTLGFEHPRTEKYLEFQSEMPKGFQDFIASLK